MKKDRVYVHRIFEANDILRLLSLVLAVLSITVIMYGIKKEKDTIRKNTLLAESYKYINLSTISSDVKVDNLTPTKEDTAEKKSMWQGKKWYAIGDNITLADIYQKSVSDTLKCQYVTDAGDKRRMGFMADKISPKALIDIDLITVRRVLMIMDTVNL